jgi:hypothetical protein
MAHLSPGEAVSDARRAFFVWRGFVRKRQSTDLDVLDHPLVLEAFEQGVRRGTRDKLALQAEFAGAIDVNRRVADLLEQLIYERSAVQLVGAEEQ